MTSKGSATIPRAALALATIAAPFAGCYSHGYQARSPVAGQSFVAIDEQRPPNDLRWSYFWRTGRGATPGSPRGRPS